MQCSSCGYPDSRVVETRQNDNLNQIVRRRECIKCGVRYTTQEHLREAKQSTGYKTSPPKRILDK